MGPGKVALVEGIMLGYKIDVAKWISQEISDRTMSTNMAIAFSCLLLKICIDAGVAQLSRIDQFMRLKIMIDLGLFRDITSPIDGVAKLGTTMIQRVFNPGGHRHNTTGFTTMDDNPTKIGSLIPSPLMQQDISDSASIIIYSTVTIQT